VHSAQCPETPLAPMAAAGDEEAGEHCMREAMRPFAWCADEPADTTAETYADADAAAVAGDADAAAVTDDAEAAHMLTPQQQVQDLEPLQPDSIGRSNSGPSSGIGGGSSGGGSSQYIRYGNRGLVGAAADDVRRQPSSPFAQAAGAHRGGFVNAHAAAAVLDSSGLVSSQPASSSRSAQTCLQSRSSAVALQTASCRSSMLQHSKGKFPWKCWEDWALP
jgi:hypothetical protein